MLQKRLRQSVSENSCFSPYLNRGSRQQYSESEIISCAQFCSGGSLLQVQSDSKSVSN